MRSCTDMGGLDGDADGDELREFIARAGEAVRAMCDRCGTLCIGDMPKLTEAKCSSPPRALGVSAFAKASPDGGIRRIGGASREAVRRQLPTGRDCAGAHCRTGEASMGPLAETGTGRALVGVELPPRRS